MNSNIQNVTHVAQRKMVEKLVDTALSKISKDREESLLKIVDLAETFYGDTVSKQQYENIRETIRLTVTGDVVERQNFITIFSKNSDSAEKELQKQAMDLVNKFNNCGIKADILNEQELIQLCNSTLNINFAFREDNNDIDDKIPYLKIS